MAEFFEFFSLFRRFNSGDRTDPAHVHRAAKAVVSSSLETLAAELHGADST